MADLQGCSDPLLKTTLGLCIGAAVAIEFSRCRRGLTRPPWAGAGHWDSPGSGAPAHSSLLCPLHSLLSASAPGPPPGLRTEPGPCQSWAWGALAGMFRCRPSWLPDLFWGMERRQVPGRCVRNRGAVTGRGQGGGKFLP